MHHQIYKRQEKKFHVRKKQKKQQKRHKRKKRWQKELSSKFFFSYS